MQCQSILISPIYIHNVLNRADCELWIAEAEGENNPYLISDKDPSDFKIEAYKVSGLYNTIEDEENASAIYSTLSIHLNHDLIPGWKLSGINESFRILKYNSGENFPIHVDPDYSRPYGHPSYGDVSFLTLVIYLNDNFRRWTYLFL